MTIELLAPAKINLGLEVLGRRDDGYHEVVTILQTIDLWDRVILEESDYLKLETTGAEAGDLPPDEENLALRAARALQAATGRRDGARILIDKEIMLAAGLGGGSSDAAAVLRGLNQLWRLGLGNEDLAAIAAGLGSDVPFFLEGGTALCTGRGEIVAAQKDIAEQDVLVFVPVRENIGPDKTRLMYGALSASDFSDGDQTLALASALAQGATLKLDGLRNAFQQPLGSRAPQAARALALCQQAGLDVHLSGAGPAFYGLAGLDALPDGLLPSLQGLIVTIFGCRLLPRKSALAMTVS